MAGKQVIVVGGGLAGHSAAHTVLQHGGRVVLLDKSPFCGGNSTKATSGINGAGTSAQRALNIPDAPEIFEQDTLRSAGDHARPDLVRALTHESGPAVEWLSKEFGLNLSIVNLLGAHSHPRTHRGGERFPGMMITYGLMEKLEAIADAEPDRARVVNKAKVTKLLHGPEGVCGVEYEKDGQTLQEHGIVIIAAGGFGADFSANSLLASVQEKWRQNSSWKDISNVPNLLSLPTTNGSHCTGDGIKMAQSVGADVVDMEFVQVHPTGLVDPSDPNAKVKWLAAEALRGCGAILLDANGRRFCNELGKRDYVSGRMFQGKAPYRLVLNSAAAKVIEWHCEHYAGRGVMTHYKTGRDFAAATGMSPDVLQDTFRKYNAAAKAGKDEFGKTHFSNAPFDVSDSFYVAMVTPVVHYTMGGLLVDDQARVLSRSGPIPGLYAAGEVVGGIHGNNRLGGSSLLDCVVFGRISGRTASRQLLQSALAASSSAGAAGPVSLEIDWGNQAVTVRSGRGGGAASTAAPAYAAAQARAAAPAAPAAPAAAPAAKQSGPALTMAEVAKHNTAKDCWVVVSGKVYDVTEFLEDHPGGAKTILAYAGKDATKEFLMLHKPDILTKYGADYLLGDLQGASIKQASAAGQTHASGREGARRVSPEELAKHTTRSDCWVCFHGKVYDVTTFLHDHPAGAGPLLANAGKDGTAAFDMAGHPSDIVEKLGLGDMFVGYLDGQATAGPSADSGSAHAITVDTSADRPPLSQMLNVWDFEAVARDTLTGSGWNYYSSGSDDEVTMRENHSVFHRIWFRPRCLVDVSNIDLSTSILGYKTSFPLYITSCALGRLAHPDGETVLARAAGKQDVIQLCPTLASCTLEEMTAARVDGQIQFFQLYVNHNRDVTRQLIQKAERLGCKALFITVDAPLLGRREKDMRSKFTQQGSSVQQTDDQTGKLSDARQEGAARTISKFIDPSLNWKDIAWIKSVTSLPLVLKGIQRGEDAVLAAKHGVQGIVCSNHGGRQLDFARSGIEVLAEVMDALDKANLRNKLEVYVDGGIRRGTDVIKALALGARAVGLGRPTLYAMAAYGQPGVEKVLQILKDEMTMNMRLLGTPSIKDMTRDLICTESLSQHIAPSPADFLSESLYVPLRTQSKL